MNQTTSICVEYKHVPDGQEAWHIFTSQQIPGLLVASRDPELAFHDVATSIQMLLKLDEDIECVVQPELSFKEFVELARLQKQAAEPKRSVTGPAHLSNTRYAVHLAA